jgi:predicted Zn-dependent protease
MPGRLRPLVLAVVMAAASLHAPVHAQLPGMGDSADMTVSEEKKMGERIARELYRDPDYIDDPIVGEYVQATWEPLMAAARARGELSPELAERFAWEILLGKDRSVNAFALPGGYLGVHMGLIALVTSRDELASVLAHELSHVTQRHISRLIAQQNRQAPWLLGAMILGALAASKAPQAANAMITGGSALAAQNQLNFSRDMEREADRIGYGVLGQAGFDPQGSVSMFDKMQQAARLNDNGSFPYLRTHPLTTERIADMQARNQLARRGAAPQPKAEHMIISARANVIANSGVDALRTRITEALGVAATASPSARQIGVLYAGSLASLKLREFDQARALQARLAAAAGGDAAAARLSNLLAAEIALGAGDFTLAAQLADAGPGGRPEMLLAAQAAVRTGAAGEMAQRLQSWVALRPRDATAWQALSSVYSAQGFQLRAIRAEAEARVAQMDYAAAMDRFKAAQDLVRRGGTNDHIEASIIDTRARQVDSLLKEQALER